MANKQFYFAGSLNADLITSADLIDHLMEYYRVGLPLNEFLKRAW